MELQFKKQITDQRGTIVFLEYGDKKINLVEIKKGFSRGGHYHTFKTRHFILSGKISYHQKDIRTGEEKTQTISAPYILEVMPYVAHLLTAIEDTVFAEEFAQDYSAIEYPQFRKIVTEKLGKT